MAKKEAKPQRADKKKKPRDWRWNRKSRAGWTSYRARMEDEMNDFAMEWLLIQVKNGQQRSGLKGLRSTLQGQQTRHLGESNVGKENGN